MSVMNTAVVGVVLAGVLVVAVGGVVYVQTNDAPVPLPAQENTQASEDTSPANPTTGSGTGSAPSPETASGSATEAPTDSYTLAQVAAHADAVSCWTTIGGSVYDLTQWISQHPGGAQAILKLCGSDGTSAFQNQHGGAQRQADTLATFKIGTLVQ